MKPKATKITREDDGNSSGDRRPAMEGQRRLESIFNRLINGKDARRRRMNEKMAGAAVKPNVVWGRGREDVFEPELCRKTNCCELKSVARVLRHAALKDQKKPKKRQRTRGVEGRRRHAQLSSSSRSITLPMLFCVVSSYWFSYNWVSEFGFHQLGFE
ncbi:unnamed protein product [Lactuca saligna]|uniref:Uncharacterized protein n=1 Tax=Lactuca saligna TaxID=75948 RepID=A0AA36ENA0_LACSI|nr:unnamed protein product [Lactuca saligna]